MCRFTSLFLLQVLKGSMICEARFQQHRDVRCHKFLFPAKEDDKGNSHHIDRNMKENLPQNIASSQKCAAIFIRGDFTTCVFLRPERNKTVTTPGFVDQIEKQIFEDTGFRLNRYLSKWVSHVSGVDPSFMKDVSLPIYPYRPRR